MSEKHLDMIPLGGMGEIGKNIVAFRYDDEILIVDGGLAFPEVRMLGVDLLIPRIDYLQQNAALIKGWVLTHGHEDHIGALPYLLPRLPRVPMYAARLTLGLLREKLSEFGIPEHDLDLREVDPDAHFRVGRHFGVDLFRMTHSIPDNSGFVLQTPIGRVIYTGDFKLDQSPTDGKTSHLAKIADAGAAGTLLLVSDSTNAERPGHTTSEAEVAEAIEKLVEGAQGRVFVTTFASHTHRIQSVIRIAEKFQRRVVVEGRSMLKYAQVALNLGYLEVKDPLISVDEMGDLPDQKVLFLCTGSQGQPMSVLSRLSMGTHARISLRRGDTVILSSSPIPGNEEAVNEVVNRLYQIGVDVYYPPTYRVHASGHGSQEDLRLIFNLASPKYFLPWHGEPRHQVNHIRLAQEMPNPPKQSLIAKNGDIVRIGRDEFKIAGSVPAGAEYVDGLGVGDINEDTLTDRSLMSTDGVLVALAILHPTPHVELVSRGVVRANRELDQSLRATALEVIELGIRNKRPLEEIRDDLYGSLRRFLRKATGRNPVLIPILVE